MKFIRKGTSKHYCKVASCRRYTGFQAGLLVLILTSSRWTDGVNRDAFCFLQKLNRISTWFAGPSYPSIVLLSRLDEPWMWAPEAWDFDNVVASSLHPRQARSISSKTTLRVLNSQTLQFKFRLEKFLRLRELSPGARLC